ncbi:helix-turn-helix domain-containing protein [Achromobacter sp. DH1f]|uniref:helix-turn-helix domain-containing protein n=1 Tax=Achromobacter sp. DH1f TaxID=1397275 RepID=UPI0004691577|nr:helix-turn-helix domain-containing protein [Achromobacter sp. DH1f]
MTGSPDFDVVRYPPSARLAGVVTQMVGYRERHRGKGFQWQESAPLAVPLIISFGTPFHIALGDPLASARWASFASGLYAGPVYISSDGAAECLQVDFTLPGAYRFFGGKVADLANHMIDLGDVLGAAGLQLRERVGNTPGWPQRFEQVEDFIALRIGHGLSDPVAHAYRQLLRHRGCLSIGALASEIGWSRKHLLLQFRAQMGLGPKALARMLRFHQACLVARAGTDPGWAQIAAAAGYADQAHMTREFTEMSGDAPQAWARRLSLAPGPPSRESEPHDPR